jgi:hypothetical protein
MHGHAGDAVDAVEELDAEEVPDRGLDDDEARDQREPVTDPVNAVVVSCQYHDPQADGEKRDRGVRRGAPWIGAVPAGVAKEMIDSQSDAEHVLGKRHHGDDGDHRAECSGRDVAGARPAVLAKQP